MSGTVQYQKNTKFLCFETSIFKEPFSRQYSSTQIWKNCHCLYAQANFASFIGFIFLPFIVTFAPKREWFGKCFLVVVNIGRTKGIPRANHYRMYKNRVNILNFNYISTLFTLSRVPLTIDGFGLLTGFMAHFYSSWLHHIDHHHIQLTVRLLGNGFQRRTIFCFRDHVLTRTERNLIWNWNVVVMSLTAYDISLAYTGVTLFPNTLQFGAYIRQCSVPTWYIASGPGRYSNLNRTDFIPFYSPSHKDKEFSPTPFFLTFMTFLWLGYSCFLFSYEYW